MCFSKDDLLKSSPEYLRIGLYLETVFQDLTNEYEFIRVDPTPMWPEPLENGRIWTGIVQKAPQVAEAMPLYTQNWDGKSVPLPFPAQIYESLFLRWANSVPEAFLAQYSKGRLKWNVILKQNLGINPALCLQKTLCWELYGISRAY